MRVNSSNNISFQAKAQSAKVTEPKVEKQSSKVLSSAFLAGGGALTIGTALAAAFLGPVSPILLGSGLIAGGLCAGAGLAGSVNEYNEYAQKHNALNKDVSKK